ncbi:hypothetical protein AAC387_Pa12g0489 [Persea americana]
MMGNKPQEEKRPRGRPRKNPLCAETNKRPRGRPRKNSNFNCAQLRDLEKQQKKEIENDKEKEKQVAEKENEQDEEEAEKENVEEKENGEDKEEAEKENVEDKETEEAEKEKDDEGSSESVRDGVRVSIFDSKNLHCAETKKGRRGRPRKNLNLNSAQLRDLENQKRIETGKEREEDAEGKEKEVAEKENEEEKAEAEKENEEEEKGKEEVDTEFAAQEMIRDGVKKRGRGRPRKNLHCAEMGKRPPGRPRKNLNCAKLRDLEKQKEIENDNEREEDMEERADEEEKEIEKENVEEEEIEIEKENEEAKEKVKEGTTEFAGETRRDGVRVSIFEYSAESYFHDIDTIASVCGTDDEESFEPHVIQRFSTAITFLREWKHFYYEPKTIRCAYETGYPHEKDVNAEISLPQFSAANVPKMEKQNSDKRFGSSSNDFVLHVGGQVWGLDWCPRNHQPECHIKCEYLAVSVHPPDSSYHKMGAPLIGRGVIQIWCILNAEEEEETAPSEPKRRGRPRLVRTEEAAPSEPKRKRGRPRLVRMEGDELETKACKGLSHEVLLPCKLGSSTGKRKRRIKEDERAGVRNGNLLIDNVDNSIIQVSDCHDDVLMASNQREAHHGPLRTSMTSSVLAKDVTLPRLVLCLAHNAKVAWDVKWRPYRANDPEYKHHMGYLAVLLGNGSLEVWEVPLPKMIKILYTSIHKLGTDPRFLKLEPVFRSSKVMCGDRQSIPLTVEWSTSAPHNMLLAGCHDGTVAMWKFSAGSSPEDTRPLLCFTADTVPIRALAWAPDGSDAESANLIVTAGHEGLRFWDIRDPYRPLWDLNPVRRVLSLDWLHDPRCLILSVDDGTLRLLSLSKAAYDVPVTGIPFVGTNLQGFHTFCCSSFSIWSVHVSRFTGQVAYCGADGSALHFQLTTKVVEKEPSRYKEPHFLCGSLTIEDSTLTINTPLPNVPCPMKKFLSESLVHAKGQPDQTPGDTKLLLPSMKVQKPKDCRNKKDNRKWLVVGEVREQQNTTSTVDPMELKRQLEVLPPKMVSLHRVRWNRNKGSQRLLCYGGAAGIVRCQVIRK